jgi:hypothetical protein
VQDERRAVLERVARGELSPTEAASLLEQMEPKPAAGPAAEERDPKDWAADWEQEPDWAPSAPPPPPAGEREGEAEGAATRIRVLRSLGTADIIGDPSVREAVAEGPHVARREGDALVIEGQDYDFDPRAGFMFGWDRDARRDMRRLQRMHHHRSRRWGDMGPLRIRVNPDLALEVDSMAGRLRIRGVHGPIRANVQAGNTDIEDFRGTLDLSCQAGSIRARGRLDHGASHVRCDAGAVRIHLERGSSVRVTARSTLGKVVVDGDRRERVTIGGGDGTLEIDATMGAVNVSAEQ